jgi:VanZ family protein
VDELYQSTVFGRFPSSFDVFADAIGLTLSIIINQKISKIVDG